MLNENPKFILINMITRFVVKGSTMFLDEKDALYTLSLTVENRSFSNSTLSYKNFNLEYYDLLCGAKTFYMFYYPATIYNFKGAPKAVKL